VRGGVIDSRPQATKTHWWSFVFQTVERSLPNLFKLFYNVDKRLLHVTFTITTASTCRRIKYPCGTTQRVGSGRWNLVSAMISQTPTGTLSILPNRWYHTISLLIYANRIIVTIHTGTAPSIRLALLMLQTAFLLRANTWNVSFHSHSVNTLGVWLLICSPS
jgi:hypothetical protein